MMAYGGVEVYLHDFLISALDGCVGSCPTVLSQEKSPWSPLDRMHETEQKLK
jgi:hypothetical protein